MLPSRKLTILTFLSLFTLSTLLSFFLVSQVRSQVVGPWFVTEGGDLHANSGGISSSRPATCTEANGCNLNHYRIKGYGPVSPGVPDALSMRLRFGEIERGVITRGGFDTDRIIYNYAYFERLFADLPDCSAADEASCFRNRSWGGSRPTAGPGIYKRTGDVTINWTDTVQFDVGGILQDVSTNWVISEGKRITLLVDGNVNIENGIRFQQTTTGAGGMLAVIASGNIVFDHTIKSGNWTGGGWEDTGQRVGGVFVADGIIETCGNAGAGGCVLSDGQILFGGVFVAWDGFELNRDLKGQNRTAPSEVFVYIPEFTACLPACFKRPIHFWQERLPGPTPTP